MKINKDIIAKLDPCKNRFDNFIKKYPSFDGDLKDFLALDNISYDDKVWVVTRLFTRAQNVKWAIACAYSVLSIFEGTYTHDKRPRQALEAATAWVNDPSEENSIKVIEAAIAVNVSVFASAAYELIAFTCAFASAASAGAASATANYTTYVNEKKQQQELNLLFLLETE